MDEEPKTLEEFLKLHPNVKVELDLPQSDIRDDPLLKEHALWTSAFEEQHGRPPNVAETWEWIDAHTPPPIERYEKVTVDFTNCRQPDGTHIYTELSPDDTCATCERPIMQHTREQMHECGLKQQQQRAASGAL